MIQAFRFAGTASEDVSVPVTATASSAGACPAGCSVVRMVALDNPVRASIGTAATASSPYLVPGVPEYALVAAGDRVNFFGGSLAAVVNLSFLSR